MHGVGKAYPQGLALRGAKQTEAIFQNSKLRTFE
jgi:hypothetical protein